MQRSERLAASRRSSCEFCSGWRHTTIHIKNTLWRHSEQKLQLLRRLAAGRFGCCYFGVLFCIGVKYHSKAVALQSMKSKFYFLLDSLRGWSAFWSLFHFSFVKVRIAVHARRPFRVWEATFPVRFPDYHFGMNATGRKYSGGICIGAILPSLIRRHITFYELMNLRNTWLGNINSGNRLI